jgi:hypothetical protein
VAKCVELETSLTKVRTERARAKQREEKRTAENCKEKKRGEKRRKRGEERREEKRREASPSKQSTRRSPNESPTMFKTASTPANWDVVSRELMLCREDVEAMLADRPREEVVPSLAPGPKWPVVANAVASDPSRGSMRLRSR